MKKLTVFQITSWLMLFSLLSYAIPSKGQSFSGYYRYPDLHGQTIVFTAEGDLWRVSVNGGMATRLTTHAEEETHARISPDGTTIAFAAAYEGPTQLYTMPIEGGLPERWTFESDASYPTAWTEQGEVVYATRHFSTLPEYQLVKLNPTTKQRTVLPLYQASEGSFDTAGKTVFFVRPADHNNVTKRYKGGTARKLWKYSDGAAEAVRLSDDYAGESHHPMWWNNRVYFITDRDGTMNIWSMNENGADLQQHTTHEDFDLRYASLHKGKIVYQRGADIWLLDLQSGSDKVVPITLASDLAQLRERWVHEPAEYVTSMQLHPEGEKVVITARGRVFVAPVGEGRLVQLSRKEGVRYRDAAFSADGKYILVLSDETGEFEFVQIAASGIGEHKQLTTDGQVLRFGAQASPDGQYFAYEDLNRDLWLYDMESGTQKKISTNREGIGRMAWSPDSKWLAFAQATPNTFNHIFMYGLDNGQLLPVTSDRANDYDIQFSPDGKWLYLLSDRNFRSLVGSPWGPRQPEPYFDKKMKLYQIALQEGMRSPFTPDDELSTGTKEEKPKQVTVKVDEEGIMQRIYEVPVPAGNYSGMALNDKFIYLQDRETGLGAESHIKVIPIEPDPKVKTMASGVQMRELSADGKKLMLSKGNAIFVVPATASAPGNLNEYKVDLSHWKFSLDPKEDFRQLFTDAWRMERDYFYDPDMHGVNWKAMHDKYLPLVDRVTTREELSDLIGRFVGELSALHTSVRGGDTRKGADNINVGSLGATFKRTDQGYQIERIYRVDPDYPDERGPLDHPHLDVTEGDIITHIDGDDVLATNHISQLLRNKANEQVRLTMLNEAGKTKEMIVTPLGSDYSIRYRDWEYSRRLATEEASDSEIGYVHLRAMGSNDISQWYREFYPVFNRKGLIIDVRGNRGGNIESFILEKLMRQTWFYWAYRRGSPGRNMPYAVNGHMVVLMDARTASDGEAFAEGFKRLGMGKLIGVRTWGGEIWLSSVNRLSDGGLARAPMNGVYSPDGEWLIEGHGVEPDIEVDNLPHATFKGEDAQLEAAIEHLKKLIEEDPRETPAPPAYPDKSFGNNGRK